MSADGNIPASPVRDYGQIAGLIRSREDAKKPKAALVLPGDDDLLKSFVEAVATGLIDPVMLGPEQLIGERLSTFGPSFGDMQRLAVKDVEEAYRAAADQDEEAVLIPHIVCSEALL